jgi:hypothetical protein
MDALAAPSPPAKLERDRDHQDAEEALERAGRESLGQ